MPEFLGFSVRVHDRIPPSCRRWQLGLTLLSTIRDYVCETGYPGLDEVDLPWLEQRIRRLQQKAYEPSSASSSGILRRIFLESQARTAAIIVLGEADFVVVMNSDGKKGFIQNAGTLDECRDEIIDVF